VNRIYLIFNPVHF